MIASKGAELLDQTMPDWWKRVQLKKLDMRSMEHCVLGQLYGSYFDGLKSLDLTSGLRHGFDSFDLEELTKAWKNQVLDRKFADA